MNKRIVIVGGGSSTWGARLMADLMLTPSIASSMYVLHDIEPANAERVAGFARKLAQKLGAGATIVTELDPDRALEGADFVLITISTGRLPAMAHDLAIPEAYRVYATVGDTVGPGGWARAMRNIPVFIDMARRIQRIAPTAVILNYTNPMAQLTRVLCRLTGQPVVGLCHGLFENLALLQKVFNLEKEEQIKASYGGINHFFWITSLTINSADGLAMVRDLLSRRTLPQILAEIEPGREYYHVADELYRFTGIMPYLGDRHISEFLPQYITSQEHLAHYHLHRTTIQERLDALHQAEQDIEDMTRGEIPTHYTEPSRETAASIINAFVTGTEFQDVGNVPNQGQIANLPLGAVVETPVIAGPLGFRPVVVGNLPEPVRTWVERQVRVQELTVEAGMSGDLDQAIKALALDPTVSHLTFDEIKEMGRRLLRANAQYLPQFSGQLA